jgi:hypothetical protein
MEWNTTLQVKGMDKYDAPPNKEFWVTIPGLIGAGFEFTKVKVKEFIDKRRGGGYATL